MIEHSALSHLPVFKNSLKLATIPEIVVALPMHLVVLEISLVALTLAIELKKALSNTIVFIELASVDDISILEDFLALALFFAVLPVANIAISLSFVDLMAIPILNVVNPHALVNIAIPVC